MYNYIPDKPIEDTHFTKYWIMYGEELPLRGMKVATSILFLILTIIALGASIYLLSLGVLLFKKSLFYVFVPIAILFPLEGILSQIALIIEFMAIIISVLLVSIDTRGGILSDLKNTNDDILSYSEAFFLGYFLSILIVSLVPVGGGGSYTLIDLYHIVLDAPFSEEISFRLIWLLLPAAIFAAYKAKKYGHTEPQKSILNIIIRGKKDLSLEDYVALAGSSLFFGFVHWLFLAYNVKTGEFFFDSGWAPGKIIQAAIIGVIMGYYALRFGLPFSLVYHWLVNTMGSIVALILYSGNEPLLYIFGSFVLSVLALGLVTMIVFIYRVFKT